MIQKDTFDGKSKIQVILIIRYLSQEPYDLDKKQI